MDLNKFAKAFDSMDYDLKNQFKITLRDIYSTFIITESSDLSSSTDLIVALLNSDDLRPINTILVQESVSKSFNDLLVKKIKTFEPTAEITKLSSAGFETIGNKIVKCTRNMINDEKSTAVCMEIFRTTKEAISLSKNAISVSLWCEKMSIAFEYINMLKAQQIWLNSSFGMTNPKNPFISGNNEIICADDVKTSITEKTAVIETSENVQFQTTFHNGKFKTLVIPFGETFAN